MTYLVELNYHDGPHVHRVPRGVCEDREQARRWLRVVRRAHRDVRAGRANVAVRKVGAS